MASLIAKLPTEGLLPLSVGSVTLQDATPGRITSIGAYPGQVAQVSKALKKMGLGWPAPNSAFSHEDAACIWSGRDQAFLVNAQADEIPGAALTDVSDGWVALGVSGADAIMVLARLVPIDLGASSFPTGAAARTSLGHMMVLIHKVASDSFVIYGFRSMVSTAIHEIENAMMAVAARFACRVR